MSATVQWCIAILAGAGIGAGGVIVAKDTPPVQKATAAIHKPKRVVSHKRSSNPVVSHKTPIRETQAAILDCPTPGLGAFDASGIALPTLTPPGPPPMVWGTPIGRLPDDIIWGGTPGTGPAVPEVGTWAFMIAGFGLVGLAMRRRQGAAE